ncbi:VOC family protein [Chitinimonas sp.]|uniref:VOC family protein n=1 Tax=Chitinimonas sp. TaxID=1934313 RepID=UPI002F926B34
MQLNHLDLPVPDVAITAAVLTRCLDFVPLKPIDADMALLRGEGGFVLVLTRARADEPPYPRDFHIGFLQPSDQAVWDAYRRLQTQGVDLPMEPRSAYGALAFYFPLPGGVTVEISHRG